jgi:hypothetical protein
MEHDVLSNREIRETLERDVVCPRIDLDKKPGDRENKVSGVTAQPFLLKALAKRLPRCPAIFRRKNSKNTAVPKKDTEQPGSGISQDRKHRKILLNLREQI